LDIGAVHLAPEATIVPACPAWPALPDGLTRRVGVRSFVSRAVWVIFLARPSPVLDPVPIRFRAPVGKRCIRTMRRTAR
jgi:hypothetical protein